MGSSVRLRSKVARGFEGRVDFTNKQIAGAAAVQAVEALGHDLCIDTKSLEMFRDLGNKPMAANGRVRDGIKVRFTHPGLSADGFGKLLGRGRNFRMVGDKVLFDIHMVDSAFRARVDGGDTLGEYVMHLAEEDPDLFGMSVVFRAKYHWTFPDGSEIEAKGRYESPPEGSLTKYPVVRPYQLDAVDAVDEPAANRDGMFSEQSLNFWGTNGQAEEAFLEIDLLLDQFGVTPEKAREFSERYFEARSLDKKGREEEMPQEENFLTVDGGTTFGSNGITFSPVSQPVADQGVALAALMQQVEEARKLAQQSANEAMRARIELQLGRSALSPEGQAVILTAIDGGLPLDKVDGMIAAQVVAEARLRELSVIQGMGNPLDGRVRSMQSDMDKLGLAVDAMIDGKRPPQGIKPLQGIRELYMLTSGDYELTGLFHPENVGFAAVTTGTMPFLVANALNKKVVYIFQSYDKWYERITGGGESAPNLHDIRWHKLGGIGEMPAVREGEAYTETEWAEDYETVGWTKKGHYIGLTMEAIDKDDTRKLQLAPRALAQSAYLTLCKDMTRLFTSNNGAGPVMRDTKNWFHTDHNNVDVLPFTTQNIKDVTIRMQKQTEIGSNERIGNLTTPEFFMVPIDLQFVALEILASAFDPNEGTNTWRAIDNPLADGDAASARRAAAARRLLINPFLTDTKDWVAIANPGMFPSVGLAFRFGSEPEVFSVSDPNSGLMFTNDTSPIKVRWFYSIGAIDHRGVFKNNVP